MIILGRRHACDLKFRRSSRTAQSHDGLIDLLSIRPLPPLGLGAKLQSEGSELRCHDRHTQKMMWFPYVRYVYIYTHIHIHIIHHIHKYLYIYMVTGMKQVLNSHPGCSCFRSSPPVAAPPTSWPRAMNESGTEADRPCFQYGSIQESGALIYTRTQQGSYYQAIYRKDL